MKRPHRIRRTLLLGGTVGIVILAGILFFPATTTRQYETRVVMIPRGASIETIAGILKADGLVGNPQLFVLAARVLGYDRHLKAGRFTVPVGSSIYRILRILARGMQPRDMVTVPEGLRMEEVVSLLFAQAKIDPVRFMSLATDSTFAASLGIAAPTVEGYLYPSTYPFYPLLTPEEVIRVMVNQGLHIFETEMALPGARADLTLHQYVTLASIVEAESSSPTERPLIAAVFYNRLRKGMMLQSDPTVSYALGVRRDRVYYKDLDVKSPYNTYRNRGLPPGPICSPGRAAFHAVVFPSEDSTTFYFVARGDGTHIFSKTWEEHLRAIAHVRALARVESTAVTSGPKEGSARPELRARTDVQGPVLRATPSRRDSGQ
jgi:peptidoglycan lytic transglycosylase G